MTKKDERKKARGEHLHPYFPLWASAWRMWGNQVTRVGVEGLSPNYSENLEGGSLKSHGVLRARILEWVATSFSSGPRFIRALHYELSWMALHNMAHNFIELLMKALLPQQGCVPIDAFELCCWRRPLRVPWTARTPNQSILKEINPEYSLDGLMLKLKFQFLATLGKVQNQDVSKGVLPPETPSLFLLASGVGEPTHWKRPWCWERWKSKEEVGGRRWDG